jgi:transposase-like protein
MGANISEICRQPGMPHAVTINKWLKKVGNGDAKQKPQDWFSFMGANNGIPVEEVK